MWCLQSVWFVQIFVCEIRNGRQTEGMMSFAQFLVSHACHNFEYFLNSCNLRKVNYVHKNYNTYKIILHCLRRDESLVWWTNMFCAKIQFERSDFGSSVFILSTLPTLSKEFICKKESIVWPSNFGFWESEVSGVMRNESATLWTMTVSRTTARQSSQMNSTSETKLNLVYYTEVKMYRKVGSL